MGLIGRHWQAPRAPRGRALQEAAGAGPPPSTGPLTNAPSADALCSRCRQLHSCFPSSLWSSPALAVCLLLSKCPRSSRPPLLSSPPPLTCPPTGLSGVHIQVSCQFRCFFSILVLAVFTWMSQRYFKLNSPLCAFLPRLSK